MFVVLPVEQPHHHLHGGAAFGGGRWGFKLLDATFCLGQTGSEKHCCIFARLSCGGRSPRCTSVKVYRDTLCTEHNYTLYTFPCHYSARSTARLADSTQIPVIITDYLRHPDSRLHKYGRILITYGIHEQPYFALPRAHRISGAWFGKLTSRVGARSILDPPTGSVPALLDEPMSPGGWLCIGQVLRRCLFEIPDDIKAKEKVVKELLAAPSCSCRPPSARAGVKRGPPLVNCWPTGSSSPRARRSQPCGRRARRAVRGTTCDS